jgi:hypothetical protein
MLLETRFGDWKKLPGRSQFRRGKYCPMPWVGVGHFTVGAIFLGERISSETFASRQTGEIKNKNVDFCGNIHT